MIWRGKALDTIGDLMDAMYVIDAAPDREAQAAAFMDDYRAASGHADVNIGYLTGYADPKTAARMRQLFAVKHPLFGDVRPTPGHAIEAGKRAALGEFDT